MPSTGLLSLSDWGKSQGNRDWMKEYMQSFGGDALEQMKGMMQAGDPRAGVQNLMQGQYDAYAQKFKNDNIVAQSQEAGDRYGLLGDQLRDPNSTNNQFNLRQMSQLFNSGTPNYAEIAASQGRGGSIAALQSTAAKRQAGLLTNSNFGQMMNENDKTALGYYGASNQAYGQAANANQGLLSLEYQDKWKDAELKQRRYEYEDQKGSFWNDLLNVGVGVGSAFLGNWAGAAGAVKGLAGSGQNRGSAGVPTSPGYDYSAPRQPLYTDSYQIGGYSVGKKWNPATGRFE